MGIENTSMDELREELASARAEIDRLRKELSNVNDARYRLHARAAQLAATVDRQIIEIDGLKRHIALVAMATKVGFGTFNTSSDADRPPHPPTPDKE